MKAIFLDRDDTVIVDVPYLSNPAEIKYFPWTKEALKIMTSKGFTLFLVTNQSGIGRGYFKEEDMNRVNEKIQNDLVEWKIDQFKEIVFCPHAPSDNCNCRKPSPKLIEDLIKKYQINRTDCYMVGDKISDAQAGKNAGIISILISDEKNDSFPTFKNILEFAKGL